ncbi:MAG: sulfate adenylyltransferase subunit CysN [Planctomycetia bacterium]|nr:sulfate adenylyltransferase subunit CysN [Planctomycetia bacterium]
MTAVESALHEDINTYLARNQAKEMLRFLTCGSVDDGKSTLIGRLLHDTKMIYEDQLAAIRRDSIRHGTTGGDIDLALLTDGLKAEREQGITIDVAYRYFSTDKRKFIIADTPGHEQYTRNMATGASNCQLAVILVDARHGVLPQTKRHSFICSLLGIQHVVVTINKMDLVDWSQKRFNEIKAQYTEFAAKLDIKDVHFIPISALRGDNIVESSTRMPWHKSGSLLNHLETVHIASDRNMQDFRFPVQMVLRPNLDFRGFAGTIASGNVRRGDEVVVLPSGRQTRIRSIVTLDGNLEEACCPMAVTLTLEDEVDVSRGDMLAHPHNVPQFGQDFPARIVWLSETPLEPTAGYLIKQTTRTTPGEITLLNGIDINTLDDKPLDTLHLNEVGRCSVSVTQPLAFDAYRRNRATGAFIVIDRRSFNTVGAGMILEREEPKGAVDPWSNAVTPRHCPQSRVTLQQRQQRLGQKPATLLLTGLTGSGKATIAYALEEKLTAMGKIATVLHGQELRRGMTNDLGFSADDRSENLRRAAEVARIFNDTGLICICAMLAPHAAVREKVRRLIGENRFLEVHLSAPLEICKQRDQSGMYELAAAGKIKAFPGVSATYEVPTNSDLVLPTHEITVEQSVERIVTLMKTRGLLTGETEWEI